MYTSKERDNIYEKSGPRVREESREDSVIFPREDSVIVPVV